MLPTKPLFNASINELRNTVKKKLYQIYKSGDETRYQDALEVLNKIDRKEIFNMNITSLGNLIFAKCKNPLYHEKYRDILEKFGLNTGYFNVKVYLENGQYEQAALTGIEEFKNLGKTDNILKEKLSHDLHMRQILEESNRRNDTVITTTILDLLAEHDVLFRSNLSHTIGIAQINHNYEIIVKNLQYITENAFSESLLKSCFQMCIENGDNPNAIQFLYNMKSKDLKSLLCFKFIKSLDFPVFVELINSLVYEGTLEIPCMLDLPAETLAIADLDNYEILGEKLDQIEHVSTLELKRLFIFMLLSSIDNTNTHLGSTIFLMNRILNDRSILTNEHKDIIFHQLSKYPFKLTALKFIKLFEDIGLDISSRNYYHALKSQFHGKEHDTAYYLLIKMMKEGKPLDKNIKSLLTGFNLALDDKKLALILEQNKPVHELERLIGFEFIQNHLEHQRERTKINRKKLQNTSEYDYQWDIKLVDSLQFD